MTPSRFLRPAAAGLFLLLLGSAVTADEKKPNLLTEKEIADGWLLLFDGETTFGWDGKAEVKDGKLLVPRGGTVTFALPLPAGRLEIDLGDAPPGIKLMDENAYMPRWAVTPDGKRQYVDFPSRFAVRFAAPSDPRRVTLVKFRPVAPDKLLNGKDLTGWKVFQDEKRAKSTFAVTAAGELSVKNGPGDLQTDRQFDDFVLHLECKTNGTALNSGVFFRCVAGQYQNGYELQVQNAYKGGDRTKPADFGTGAIYRRVPARKVVSNDNEWFGLTLLAVGPQFATWVNGYPVVSWKDDRPANDNPRQGLKTGKGHLSIQGHDPTTDLLFRNLRVAEVK